MMIVPLSLHTPPPPPVPVRALLPKTLPPDRLNVVGFVLETALRNTPPPNGAIFASALVKPPIVPPVMLNVLVLVPEAVLVLLI
jgi:hypothetical protein